MSMCPAIALRYIGLTVRVESMNQQDLAWLEEFLVPPFELVDGVAGDCAVSCEIDAERHAALLGEGMERDGTTLACFALEQRLVHLPVWTSLGAGRLVYDEELNMFYSRTAGAPHVQLLTPPGESGGSDRSDACCPRVCDQPCLAVGGTRRARGGIRDGG